MLKKKWPEDIYFNGITVILQDRKWFTTPYIADVKFLIKIKKFKINICALIFNESTLLYRKGKNGYEKTRNELMF